MPVVAKRDLLGPEGAAALRALVLGSAGQRCLDLLEECSTVYSTAAGAEQNRPDRRLCRRGTYRATEVFDAIEQTLLPALLPGKATAVCRSHYDVILYNRGDFFGEHRDYARVWADNVSPHFGIYSLAEEPCEGGATIVEGVPYYEATFPDGALACRAELLHEAAPVTAGAKLVLKFDFLLLEGEPVLSAQGPSAASGAEKESLVLAGGAVRTVERELLEKVPFFQGALRFPRVEGAPLELGGLNEDDLDTLLEYVRGSTPPQTRGKELLETVSALSMYEAAAAPSWDRFLAGAPVFVPEETADLLWRNPVESLVPFVVVTAQKAGTSRVSCAVAGLPGGEAWCLAAEPWALPDRGLFFGKTPQPTPRAAALHASEVLCLRAARGTERDDYCDAPWRIGDMSESLGSLRLDPGGDSESGREDEQHDNRSLLLSALALRAPLLLEMLHREAASDSAVQERLVKEEEYCNDGDCDVFWHYETLAISHRFGIFRR